MDRVARLIRLAPRPPPKAQRAALLPMAVQNIRQEFAHDIEAGSGQKRDAGILGDISRALPTGWPPNAGDRAGADDAGYARNRKGSPAVGVLRNHRAQSRVAGP